ncbi:MAG: hypothetical protein AAFY34_12410 [Pseudomonadota bacterium]
MRTDDALFSIAIEQIGLAVIGLIGWTGIHIAERTPVKWRLRRAGTKLKALENLVRRLIMLIALKLDVTPSEGRNTNKVQKQDVDPQPSETLGDIEQAVFPKTRRVRLSLLPPLMDFSERPDFSGVQRSPTPVHIAVRRFSRRIIALQRVLDAPEAHAKRLARRLYDLRQSGELTPIVAPGAPPAGLSPEIGILHGGISFELREALKGWASARPDIDPGDRCQRRRPRQGP